VIDARPASGVGGRGRRELPTDGSDLVSRAIAAAADAPGSEAPAARSAASTGSPSSAGWVPRPRPRWPASRSRTPLSASV
jgi:hypothetical protein